jgi:hypothetical protein
LLVLLAGACHPPNQTVLSGSLDAVQLYPDPNPVEFTYQPESPVLPIDFGSFSEKTVILGNATGRQVFLVKANSSTRVIPGTGTGAALSRSLSLDPASYTDRREHEAALLFNANPPLIPPEPPVRSLTRAITYGETNPSYVVGSTKTFGVEKADGTWAGISATLRSIGRYSYIWVADGNFDDTSTRNWDNLITDAQAGLIRDKFDGTIAAGYKDGVFRNVSTIFGYEFGGGDASINAGGRDGDQHISILIYDIDADYASSQNGGVFGYFWSKDFYTQAQLDSYYASYYPYDPVPQTNLAEIFYLDAHFADKYPNDIYSTMAHEYQHMIHFNMKNVRLDKNSAVWFNEMCSMVAEDLVLENIELDPVTDGPQSRLDIFAYHYAESGVSDWLYGDEVLKSYAGAFAFGAYLTRNFGGAAFFHELLYNNGVNEAAITTAMAALSVDGSVDNGLGFSQELLRYGEALVLTAAPAGEGLRSLNKAVTSTLADAVAGDTISYTALPINLDDIQQYNLSTGYLVSNGFGLRTYHPLDTPSLRPYGSSIHTQDSWASISGDLEIILEAPGDSAVRYYLIVR